MTEKIEAIILRSFEVGEVDRIYIVFSRERGKIKILGKGTRKITARLAGGMEPLNHSEIFLIKGRVLDRVVGVILDNQYLALRKELTFLMEVKKVLSKLERICQEGVPAVQLFDLTLEYLDFLNKLEKNKVKSLRISQLAQIYIFWQMLLQSGFQPELYSCLKCHKRLAPNQDYFFLIPDGVVCAVCLKKDIQNSQGIIRVNENIIKTIRLFVKQPLQVVTKLALNKDELTQVNRISKDILRVTLEID